MKKAILQILTAILALGLFCGAASAATPIANFSYSPTQGYAPLTVNFTDLSKNETSFTWNFGDGNTDSIHKKLPHKFEDPDNYPVILEIQNVATNGTVLNNSTTQSVKVSKFDFDTNISEENPLKVQFTSVSNNDITLNGWNWNFGDNSTNDDTGTPTPSHTYQKAGTYTVTLNATQYNDQNLTVSKDITVSGNNTSDNSANNTTGDRIWETGMPTTYTWNALSFSGFYYDLDSGKSSESMTITDIGKTIEKGNIQYVTNATLTKFKHKDWGSYQILGFMAEKYFAGYTEDDVVNDSISPISDGILSKILIDSDDKKTASTGDALTLEEGYTLNIKEVDINGNNVLVQLEKDGKVVDDGVVSAGGNYIYKTDLGSSTDVPIIIVHFGSVFSGAESSAVFVQGIFQISGDYTEVKEGDDFGKMEVNSLGDGQITMDNTNTVGLDKGDTVDLMGNVKIKVADNSSILRFAPIVDTTQTGSYDLRGTVYDRSINGNNFPSWNTKNFEGFYYNLDDGIGTENLSVQEIKGNTIEEDNLVYFSKPQAVNFKYKGFGNFTVVGFMADEYFAGYIGGTVDKVDDLSLLSSNILSKVLTDSNDRESMTSGSSLALEEGYSLSIKEVDINGNNVWVNLEKDGKVVDDSVVSSGKDYVYKTDLGKATDVPLIIVHFGSVFSGAESSAVFVNGIFQISDEYTEVNEGDAFDKMKVSTVSEDGIEMKNSDDSIGLDKGKNTTVMGNISFRTADDSDTLRFYPFVTVESGGSSNNGLNVSVPDEIYAGSAFDITVTAGGDPVEDAIVKIGGESVGNTSSDGIVEYTAENASTLKLTVQKNGYSTVTKSITVIPPKEEMSLKISPDQNNVSLGDTITITAFKNLGGDPIEGVNISIDDKAIGATGSDGNITYTTDKNGTIKISATKNGFNDNSVSVQVKDRVPKFAVSNLTVKPMEVDAGKNVTISANVKNIGNAPGPCTAVLFVNNTATNDSKDVIVGVGENASLNFTHSEKKEGNYTVQIQVQPPEQQVQPSEQVIYKVKPGSPIILYALIVFVVLIIGGAAYYFTKGGGDIEAIQAKVQELVSSIKLKK